MIHGIFLTPQAFDELGRTHGEHDGLEALKQVLFPTRSVCDNVLLVDPQSDNWWRQVMKMARSLPAQSRYKAFDLLQKVETRALARVRCSRDVPQREQQWVKLATKETSELVDWVLCSRESQETDENMRVFACDRIHDEGWTADAFPWQSDVPRTWAGQRRLLHKLCELSDWCVVELPYLRGGDDDEIVTAKQLAQLASQRAVPSGKHFTLDVICRKKGIKESKVVRNIRKSLEETVTSPDREVRIRVFGDHAALNRNILAGTSREVADGKKTRTPRWLIRAQHVAVGKLSSRDDSTGDNNWSLDSAQAAKRKWEAIEQQIDQAGESVVGEIVLK